MIMKWSVPVALSLALAQLLLAQAGDQIDPSIYAKLFMNNKPIFDRMSAAVLEKLPSGGRVLDLASGPGEPSVTLARTDSKVRIVCTDFQAAMNEKAKARAEAAAVTKNMEFALTSADDLSQWNDNTFDAVTMNFGLMFVPDKQKSLHEIYRVLKPGGFAYVSVWKELLFQTVAHEFIDEVAGRVLPEFEINPLKLKDDNAVEDFARTAMLKIVGDERLTYAFTLGTAKETADGLTILVGDSLKQLEAEGNTGATSKFYEVVEREVKVRGWENSQSLEVTIPDNSPQMLILEKPSQEEL